MPALADLALGAGDLPTVVVDVEVVPGEALVPAVLPGGVAPEWSGDGDLVFTGGLFQVVFAALNIGLTIWLWVRTASADAASQFLCLVGILGALPDLFSLTPTFLQDLGLAAKIGVDVIAMIGCGLATSYCYCLRSAASLSSGTLATPR
ncbi:hypothetical protein ABZ769_36860 [Streptomyces olivoreticuli]